jgi:hypothetical protein
MEVFRERASEKLQVICKEMDELRQMFTDCEAANRDKTKTGIVFSKSDELYGYLLKVDGDRIMKVVQDDIAKVQRQLKAHQSQKEEKVMRILNEITFEI